MNVEFREGCVSTKAEGAAGTCGGFDILTGDFEAGLDGCGRGGRGRGGVGAGLEGATVGSGLAAGKGVRGEDEETARGEKSNVRYRKRGQECR